MIPWIWVFLYPYLYGVISTLLSLANANVALVPYCEAFWCDIVSLTALNSLVVLEGPLFPSVSVSLTESSEVITSSCANTFSNIFIKFLIAIFCPFQSESSIYSSKYKIMIINNRTNIESSWFSYYYET